MIIFPIAFVPFGREYLKALTYTEWCSDWAKEERNFQFDFGMRKRILWHIFSCERIFICAIAVNPSSHGLRKKYEHKLL